LYLRILVIYTSVIPFLFVSSDYPGSLFAASLSSLHSFAMGDLSAFASLPMASQPGEGPIKGSKDGAPAAKRKCLRHYDLVPSQLLNAMGVSGIDSIPLDKLWQSMGVGNKQCAFFSEYCDDDESRHAIAMSRYAQVMVMAINKLKEQLSAQVIAKEVYTAAMKEAEQLLPSFMALDRSTLPHVSSGKVETMRNVAYYSGSSSSKAMDTRSVTLAANTVYEWLHNQNSMLRAVVAFLSTGGLFYVAHCHDKATRAFVKHSPCDKEGFASRATSTAQSPVEPMSDTAALNKK
jgi:hypothetical protein